MGIVDVPSASNLVNTVDTTTSLISQVFKLLSTTLNHEVSDDKKKTKKIVKDALTKLREDPSLKHVMY
jgi:hypothetical protein